MRCLKIASVTEILRLSEMGGLTMVEIGTGAGCSKSTVSEILKRCRECDLTYHESIKMTTEQINELIYPDSFGRKPVKADPDWKKVHAKLSDDKRMNLRFLWEKYRIDNPEGLSYPRFCVRYNEWLSKTGKTAVMPQEREPGRELFIDWIGDTLDCIIDRATGKLVTAHFFVTTLGDSSYPYVEAFPDEKSDKWLTGHVNAFRWYGGLPRILVPDNCRTAVNKVRRYDPELNQAYLDMALYYGVAIIPARPVKPRDKAAVESSVGWLETWLLMELKDKTYFSFDALNTDIRDLVECLAERRFQKRPGSRKSIFDLLDKPALRPLPIRPYEIAAFTSSKVPDNLHVEAEGFYYSVPYAYHGQQVRIRMTATTVEITNSNRERIAIHQRCYTGKRYVTNDAHMPENFRHQMEARKFDGAHYRSWAVGIGDSVYQVIDYLLTSAHVEEQAYKSCMGLLQSSKKYGNTRLNAACEKAIQMHSITYTTIINILKNHQDKHTMFDTDKPTPYHENLRIGEWK